MRDPEIEALEDAELVDVFRAGIVLVGPDGVTYRAEHPNRVRRILLDAGVDNDATIARNNHRLSSYDGWWMMRKDDVDREVLDA